MISGHRVAAAAKALAGTRFRLHGRDPATGLDCVGLVACALGDSGTAVTAPNGYRLHNRDIAQWLTFARMAGLHPVNGRCLPGDILLVTPGPWQHHLVVASGGEEFVHAHAGLDRVVVTPGPLPWPVLRHWRQTAKG